VLARLHESLIEQSLAAAAALLDDGDVGPVARLEVRERALPIPEVDRVRPREPVERLDAQLELGPRGPQVVEPLRAPLARDALELVDDAPVDGLDARSRVRSHLRLLVLHARGLLAERVRLVRHPPRFVGERRNAVQLVRELRLQGRDRRRLLAPDLLQDPVREGPQPRKRGTERRVPPTQKKVDLGAAGRYRDDRGFHSRDDLEKPIAGVAMVAAVFPLGARPWPRRPNERGQGMRNRLASPSPRAGAASPVDDQGSRRAPAISSGQAPVIACLVRGCHGSCRTDRPSISSACFAASGAAGAGRENPVPPRRVQGRARLVARATSVVANAPPTVVVATSEGQGAPVGLLGLHFARPKANVLVAVGVIDYCLL